MSLQQTSIPILLQECSSQIRAFEQKNNTANDSPSCGEIVRRAATGPDMEALGVLLYEVTRPLVERLCPSDLRNHKDDFVQEVLVRLLRKFRHPDSPFTAQGFPAYRIYLNFTVQKAATSLRQPETPSLDHLMEQGIEPAKVEQESDLERNEAAFQILRRITNPTGREIIRRLYIENETYDEILEALKATDSNLKKKQVYKLAENAMKQLKGAFGVK